MMINTLNSRRLRAGMDAVPLPIVAVLLTLVLAPGVGRAQTEVEPGFNLFNKDQEIEIGRESAQQVEEELPVLENRRVVEFIQQLGSRLARQAPGEEYPYEFEVLNLADVNAFALPGGFIYVNRGLIEEAETEAQLAGVLAHEIAHVALRHSTNQLSKAYLAQAGIAALGGLLGEESTAGDVVQAVGGVGLPLLFLSFSRSAEEQADTVAAQMMAEAGYDPAELARFFERLQQEGRGGPPEFLSSHPSYENRRENIRQAAGGLEVRERDRLGDLSSIQSELGRMASAPRMEDVVDEQGRTERTEQTDRGSAEIRVERPSTRFREFTHRSGYYRIAYPDNWEVHEARDGFGATIAPDGGIVRTSTDRQEVLYGVIINHYAPFDRAREDERSLGGLGFRSDPELEDLPVPLEEATRDLILQIMDGNPHLQPERGSMERVVVDDRPAVSAVLTGTSPVTGEQEHVTLVAREAGDGHVIYVLMIAPGDHRSELERTFDRMLSTLEVDDRAVHEPTS